ncbi:hypothetical protein VCM39_12705 [Bacteroides sp. CG01]|uniref:hypothetical protein n=1 Tax=Bacteroides sp. CG01 TaxID=3096000 RepID=UPI002AFF8335|nr:hypothetical protein [Bacteroides sp. CG01]
MHGSYRFRVNKINRLFIIFFSFFLSSLSGIVLMDFLGFPFKAVEVLLLIFLFYHRKRIFLPIMVQMQFIIIGLLLYGLGMFWHDSELGELLSSLRYYFFFVIGFMLFRYSDLLSMKDIAWCAFFTTVFELLAGLVLINKIQNLNSINEDIPMVNNANFILIGILISCSLLVKSKIQMLVLLCIALTASFLSITRGILLYAIVALIFSFFALCTIYKSYFKLLFIFVFLFLIGIFAYNNLEDEILQTSPSMHHRLYTKVDPSNNDASGDQTRIYHLMYILKHPGQSLIPHGFPVWKGLPRFKKTNWTQSSISDCSLAALVYTFGFFVFILIYKYLRIFFRYWCLFLRNKEPELYMLLIVLSLFPLYFVFGYGLIEDVSKVFSCGMVLGVVKRKLYIYSNK